MAKRNSLNSHIIYKKYPKFRVASLVKKDAADKNKKWHEFIKYTQGIHILIFIQTMQIFKYSEIQTKDYFYYYYG